MTLQEKLENLRACPDARAWVGERDLAVAWAECERADWMMWFAAKTLDRKIVVEAVCACAQTSLKYTKDTNETADAKARAERLSDDVKVRDSYIVAYTVTSIIVDIADTAYVAAHNTTYSIADAYFQDDATYVAQRLQYAAAYAARKAAYKEMADIVRGIITAEHFAEVLK